MKPTVLTIAYSRLVPLDEINARDETKEGLPEMVASIELRGLIQPLAVRPADNGKYEIIDGRRRYRAIAKLIRDKSKGWTRQSDVPVLVRNEDDSQALESSMIANTVRLPMHPVEQYKVLVRLADRGMTASEIGVRFALPARKVAQNLALGRLAPAIRDAWLKEKIDEDVARAFTVEPREDLQVAAFDRLKKTANGLNAQNVRRELEGTRRPAKDVSAAVLAAYDAAGGEKSVDLFEDATYLTDAALLKKIEAEREDKVLERFRADGWKFVMRHTEVPGGKWWSLPQIEVDPDEVFTPQQQARMAELNIFTGSGAEREAVDAELEELARLGATAAFTAKQRARSGVILRFHGDGDYQATFGVLLDGAQVVAAGNDDSEDGDDEHVFDDAGDDWSASDAATTAESDGDGLGISNALLETLTRGQTAVVDKVLTMHPDLAIRVLLAALTATNSYGVPIKMTASGIRANADVGRGRGTGFAAMLPKVVDLDAVELGRRLADVVGSAVDVINRNTNSPHKEARALVDILPASDYLDEMRAMFDAAGYFKRVTRAHAINALEEITEAGFGAGLPPEDVLFDAKKPVLAELASTYAVKCGWLPVELRSGAYVLIDNSRKAAA